MSFPKYVLLVKLLEPPKLFQRLILNEKQLFVSYNNWLNVLVSVSVSYNNWLNVFAEKNGFADPGNQSNGAFNAKVWPKLFLRIIWIKFTKHLKWVESASFQILVPRMKQEVSSSVCFYKSSLRISNCISSLNCSN